MVTPAGHLWIALAALLCGTAVATGAFAAHGLGPLLVEKYGNITKEIAGQPVAGPLKYLGDFKTAAEYQMTHGLAMLVVGLLTSVHPGKLLHIAGIAFLVGIVLFSGSLYLLVLTGVTVLGAVTPLGGISFLIGWGCLAIAVLTAPQRPAAEQNSTPR
jgi:uncharacterized membrane protein YgdD (TMEM256/DUF423 family)